MNRYLSLESLRGLAAVSVALFHSAFVVDDKYPVVAQAGIFVDMFFVLSGFVMFFAYQRKIANGMAFSNYILLRFGRLYPLHLFVLLTWIPYILIKGYVFSHWHIGTDPYLESNLYSFFTNLLMLQSVGLHDHFSWNYPSWSISVEFFTYIVFFYVVKLTGDRRGFDHLLIISIFAYATLWGVTDETLLRSYDYGLIRCLGGFFFGAWICTLVNKITWSPNPVVATVVESAAVALSLFLVLNSSESPATQTAAFGCFGLLIGIFSIQSNGVISQLLKHKLLVALGTLSYSIYMIHAIVFASIGHIYQYILDGDVRLIARDGAEPLKALVTPYADLINLGGLAIIIALSWLTYRYVERPSRSFFRQIALRNGINDTHGAHRAVLVSAENADQNHAGSQGGPAA